MLSLSHYKFWNKNIWTKSVFCYSELKMGEYLVEISKNEKEEEDNKSSLYSKL